jgi:phosphoenolpyruvate synthase/pyruvate phosphate dikinase
MWLATATDTLWKDLAEAIGRGLPVPEGFVVCSTIPEVEIRAAYEDLKIRTRVHFVAVRGPSHSMLNVIGPDQLIHTLRRFWAESVRAAVLVQRMVPAVWCGKAQKDGAVIRANQGLSFLDPDTYILENGMCVRRSIEPKQRKMLRYVDGTMRTVERDGERSVLTDDQLKKIAELAIKAAADISWALDDQDQAWLLAVNAG